MSEVSTVERRQGGNMGPEGQNHPDFHPWIRTATTPAAQGRAGESRTDPASLEAWLEAKLDWQREQIEQLIAAAETESPTIEKTLRLYDRAISALSIAGSQMSLLDSVYPDKEVRDRARELAQRVAEAATSLSLNQEVFCALERIDLAGADPATAHYLTQTLLNYRLAGVDKDEPTRAHLRQLADKATELALAFANHVQENRNEVIVRDPGELEGLPADYLANHPAGGDGGITLTTDYPDMQPVMTFAQDGGLRLRMFRAYNTRAYPVNRQVLLDLLAVRQEIASVLGFSSWADLATANQMMGSADNMKAFIGQLEEASREGAATEYRMMLDFARQRQPQLAAIKSSDRAYWYEQYRRAAFDFDSQSVRPYFPYEQVAQGIFDTAERLFHIRFERCREAMVWDESVTAWEVYDQSDPPDGFVRDGVGEQSARSPKKLGRFYLDMHPRPGKDKWFSAAPLIPGVAGEQLPEAALVCNFPGGKAGDPGLMQYSDVVTFFHEFGHLMHAILGGCQRWAGVSGIATEGDFVEAPSQMLEEFFRDAKVLAGFARHYQTGEPIPEALVERMNRASAFGRADSVRTQLLYTSYSLELHALPADGLDPDALLEEDYKRLLPYEWVEGNRMYASFTHLTGYSSNYYTYMFDKVIALDFFRQFDSANPLDGPAAMRYRRTILEPGGSQPGRLLIENFLGREQSMDALTEWIGEEFR